MDGQGSLTRDLTLSAAEVVLLLPDAVAGGTPGAWEVFGEVGGRHDPICCGDPGWCLRGGWGVGLLRDTMMRLAILHPPLVLGSYFSGKKGVQVSKGETRGSEAFLPGCMCFRRDFQTACSRQPPNASFYLVKCSQTSSSRGQLRHT